MRREPHGKRGPGSKKPQQSAERRAGGRIPPVISGDPEIGSTARRVIGCGASAPAPVGALLPLIFSGAETDKGCPPPQSKRAAELWPIDPTPPCDRFIPTSHGIRRKQSTKLGSQG